MVKQVTGGASSDSDRSYRRVWQFGDAVGQCSRYRRCRRAGFGDPNGIPKDKARPNAHLVAANTGAFDLPQGAGNGNGSGGNKGIKGTIASAGFGNGIAQGGQGDGRSNGRGATVQTAGLFRATGNSVRAATGRSRPKRGPATTPVEIISKPNPVYTRGSSTPASSAR